jgi:hypothetical protein
MLGLSYTNFTQYGTVTISGSIAANTLNLDNASYMEIGLITKLPLKSQRSGIFQECLTIVCLCWFQRTVQVSIAFVPAITIWAADDVKYYKFQQNAGFAL